MNGLDALAAMGLTVKEDVIEDMLNHLHTIIP
jgi:hypothetical protein